MLNRIFFLQKSDFKIRTIGTKETIIKESILFIMMDPD